MRDIRFGTSGWRGIIADDFTFERASYVVAAIATYLQESGVAERGVIVAHDPRFLAEEFSANAARQLVERGIDVLLVDRPTPTPAVSYIIMNRQLGGGINFTASHNPAIYQGLKFNPSWAGPALPDTTSRIESLTRDYMHNGMPSAGVSKGSLTSLDPAPEYLEGLGKIVDLDKIASSGLPITYDPLYGAGAGFLDRILEDNGCSVKVTHNTRDPLFGGRSPDPSEDRLSDLMELVKGQGGLGIATDGDADRFGILGASGEFYQPNEILSLLADYLLGKRNMKGDLARSVATTHLLDRIAGAYGCKCRETPVGFKYIGEMISKGFLVLGGEESAGMSIGGHVPEKDGLLPCLLIAEMLADSGRNMEDMKKDLDRKYGLILTKRINIELDEKIKARLELILKSPPRVIGGLEADRLNTIDGTKWIFNDGSWSLLRLSGTEPVARLYIEAENQERLDELERIYRNWISGR